MTQLTTQWQEEAWEPGSKAAGIAMAFKLIEAAQKDGMIHSVRQIRTTSRSS